MFIKIVLALLIIFTAVAIGGILAFWMLVSCYATDPNYWHNKIEPFLKDVREWVDAGNKVKNYPTDRLEKFIQRYDK